MNDGVLLIHKPAGPSSASVLNTVHHSLAKSLGTKKRNLKMGHAGTLDPFATGLLVGLVGRATRLSDLFLGADKSYRATAVFGKSSVSGDPTDSVIQEHPFPPLTQELFVQLATSFINRDYWQTPPMHSAVKIDGKPLYELARQGITVDRQPKLRRILKLEVVEWAYPQVTFDVTCTSGTYIRTLVQDLAKGLSSHALLGNLHRIRSGQFGIERALTPDELAKHECPLKSSAWVPFQECLRAFPSIELSANDLKGLQMGRVEVISKLCQEANSQRQESRVVVQFQSEAVALLRRGVPDPITGASGFELAFNFSQIETSQSE